MKLLFYPGEGVVKILHTGAERPGYTGLKVQPEALSTDVYRKPSYLYTYCPTKRKYLPRKTILSGAPYTILCTISNSQYKIIWYFQENSQLTENKINPTIKTRQYNL